MSGPYRGSTVSRRMRCIAGYLCRLDDGMLFVGGVKLGQQRHGGLERRRRRNSGIWRRGPLACHLGQSLQVPQAPLPIKRLKTHIQNDSLSCCYSQLSRVDEADLWAILMLGKYNKKHCYACPWDCLVRALSKVLDPAKRTRASTLDARKRGYPGVLILHQKAVKS